MMKVPLEKLTTYANSYAAAHGLQVQVMKKQQIEAATDSSSSSSVAAAASSSSYQCAPISLLPNVFPYSAFASAQELAPGFNLLVDRISQDGEFLIKTLGGEHGVISKDDYTRKLLELYTDIYMNDKDEDHDDDGAQKKKKKKKPNFAKEAAVLGIHRSDYMLHPTEEESEGGGDGGGYGLKQVELNTIAASFAGLAVNVAGLHKMLTERFGYDLKVRLDVCTFVGCACTRWCNALYSISLGISCRSLFCIFS
jgi:Eukaryotic glutathione synthase, ATP binding domain.